MSAPTVTFTDDNKSTQQPPGLENLFSMLSSSMNNSMNVNNTAESDSTESSTDLTWEAYNTLCKAHRDLIEIFHRLLNRDNDPDQDEEEDADDQEN